MRRAIVGLALLAGLGAAVADPSPPPLRSTRELTSRLRAAGRAEAAVTTTVADPLTDQPHTVRGRLALELPRFARLDFQDGESLTLREDGGDWLQPRAQQLVRSGPRSAEAALRWSAALLETGAGRFHERALGGRGYELVPAGPDSAERQRVWLGTNGLPARLEVTTASGEKREVRLSGWTFRKARGRSAFVLNAPPGCEVVDLP